MLTKPNELPHRHTFTSSLSISLPGIDDFLKDPVTISSLIFTTFGKYLITTIAGVDFMVNEIASQRNFEIYLETGEDRTLRGYMNSHKNILAGPDGRFRILNMMKQRNERLDDLCKANRKAKTAESMLSSREWEESHEMVKTTSVKVSTGSAMTPTKRGSSSANTTMKPANSGSGSKGPKQYGVAPKRASSMASKSNLI